MGTKTKPTRVLRVGSRPRSNSLSPSAPRPSRRELCYPRRPFKQADGDYRYMAEPPHARSHFPLVPPPTVAARRRRLSSPPTAPSSPQPSAPGHPPPAPGPPPVAGPRPHAAVPSRGCRPETAAPSPPDAPPAAHTRRPHPPSPPPSVDTSPQPAPAAPPPTNVVSLSRARGRPQPGRRPHHSAVRQCPDALVNQRHRGARRPVRIRIVKV